MAIPIHILASQALSRFEPFRGIEPAVLERLAQSARTCRAVRGEMVVHRGARPAGMYLVIEGEVKLFLNSAAGAEKVVRLAGAGDSFCEEDVFGDAPQPLSAQATRPGLILLLPRAALQAAIADQPALARALMARLSQRVGELVEGIEVCVQRSSTQRVAHYLVQHADPGTSQAEVRLPCDKQTIASQLNLTPETFSRVLNRLRREGFILPLGRRAIMLTDLPRLQSMAA